MPENVLSPKFDKNLNSMMALGRPSGVHAINTPLAVLGLVHLFYDLRLDYSVTNPRFPGTIQECAEAVDKIENLSEKRFTQYLLAELSKIDPLVQEQWFQIAKCMCSDTGSADWMLTKMRELEFYGQFHTPSEVIDLVVSQLLSFKPTKDIGSIFDPACGTGGFLIGALENLKNDDVEIAGEEANTEAWAWAQLRLAIQKRSNVSVELGDVRRKIFNKFTTKAEQFDVIVSNPPYGVPKEISNIPWIEQAFGSVTEKMPTRISSEVAVVLEAAAKLSPSGVAAVIVPNGFLSKGGFNLHARQFLFHQGLVRAVVSLPARLFAPRTAIETSILFLQQSLEDKRSEEILFIDARSGGVRAGSKTVLDDRTSGRISDVLLKGISEIGFSQIVSLDQIERNDFSLFPAHYVKVEDVGNGSFDDRRVRIIDLQEQYVSLNEEYEKLRTQLCKA